MDIELVDVAVSGSRCRGLEQESSDLDVVVEYRGGETEDSLFNTFNEDGLSIGGVKVDINPITEGKTGTLPSLLIADEPTTALDVTIQAQILHLMNELKREKGTSILFITHDLGVINEMADSVAVMYCGQVVEMCDAHTIFARDNEYSHPYTEGLMTSIPRLDTPVGTRLDAIPGSVPHPLDLPKGCKFAPRCKYATAKCMEEEPKLEEVEGNHSVRCFYPEKEGRHATK